MQRAVAALLFAVLITGCPTIMGLFDWFGWGKSPPRPVGHELETGGRNNTEEAPRLRHWLIRGGLFLGLVVLTVVAFPRGEVYEYAVQVGDTWQQSTLEAPFDFPIYIDQDRVQARRDSVRNSTPPFFREVPRPRQKLAANRDTLARQVERILEAYAGFRYHESQDEPDAARDDSLRYVEQRRNALATLSSSEWDRLAKEYARQVQGRSEATRTGDNQESRVDQQLLDQAFELGTQLLNVGVMDKPQDSVSTDVVVVRNQQERSQRNVDKSNVYGLNEAYDYVEEQLRRSYADTPGYADIAFSLFRGIFQPSLEYMRTETMDERSRRAQNVTAIQGGVESGEVIVRQGERVTPEIKRKLTSLERVRTERMSSANLGKQVLGQVLFAVLAFAFFFYYLYLLRKDVWRQDKDMGLVALVLSFVIAMFAVGVRVEWINLYAVPVALASVLLTIIFNSRIGLFGTLVLAFLGGQMLGLDLEYTLATFFAGALGVFSVRDIKNRGQFFLSAALVFLGYVLVLTASW
ncbi:MAG: metal-dependent phosphohydrolase, partial [Salinivenus sp.]